MDSLLKVATRQARSRSVENLENLTEESSLVIIPEDVPDDMSTGTNSNASTPKAGAVGLLSPSSKWGLAKKKVAGRRRAQSVFGAGGNEKEDYKFVDFFAVVNAAKGQVSVGTRRTSHFTGGDHPELETSENMYLKKIQKVRRASQSSGAEFAALMAVQKVKEAEEKKKQEEREQLEAYSPVRELETVPVVEEIEDPTLNPDEFEGNQEDDDSDDDEDSWKETADEWVQDEQYKIEKRVSELKEMRQTQRVRAAEVIQNAWRNFQERVAEQSYMSILVEIAMAEAKKAKEEQERKAKEEEEELRRQEEEERRRLEEEEEADRRRALEEVGAAYEEDANIEEGCVLQMPSQVEVVARYPQDGVRDSLETVVTLDPREVTTSSASLLAAEQDLFNTTQGQPLFEDEDLQRVYQEDLDRKAAVDQEIDHQVAIMYNLSHVHEDLDESDEESERKLPTAPPPTPPAPQPQVPHDTNPFLSCLSERRRRCQSARKAPRPPSLAARRLRSATGFTYEAGRLAISGLPQPGFTVSGNMVDKRSVPWYANEGPAPFWKLRPSDDAQFSYYSQQHTHHPYPTHTRPGHPTSFPYNYPSRSPTPDQGYHGDESLGGSPLNASNLAMLDAASDFTLRSPVDPNQARTEVASVRPLSAVSRSIRPSSAHPAYRSTLSNMQEGGVTTNWRQNMHEERKNSTRSIPVAAFPTARKFGYRTNDRASAHYNAREHIRQTKEKLEHQYRLIASMKDIPAQPWQKVEKWQESASKHFVPIPDLEGASVTRLSRPVSSKSRSDSKFARAGSSKKGSFSERFEKRKSSGTDRKR